MNVSINNTNSMKASKYHPCFNPHAKMYARLHLPVAPGCNIRCNYCNRKYDCTNESRPGVTSKILTPKEAFDKYLDAKSTLENLKVIGISGPGDPLHEFEKTRRTLELIRKKDTRILFCLSTNGLMLPSYGDSLIDIGVSHITVTINAVDVKIASMMYEYIYYNKKRYTGAEAAKILISNQLEGLSKMSSAGAVCKVNIVMVNGINDRHVIDVVSAAKNYGAYMTNITKMIPVNGSTFEKLEPVDNNTLNITRLKSERHIRQMYHCRQCRADAAGMLEKYNI